MDLDGYLRRIGYSGLIRPDLATLRGVHRAHQLAVPFENLDVQLRRPVALDAEAAFDKIVRRRRGGWCYELNGLMAEALKALGFRVTRLCAGVMREHEGDAQLGNHLCLLVELDEPYLVDVGFGGSLLEPLPLAAGARSDVPYDLCLSQLDDGHWRFVETTQSEPFSFDFRLGAADENLFARHCQRLQTEASSPFVQNLVVQRRTLETHLSLRGRVLTTLTAAGATKAVLRSAEELVATLRDRFDLDVPEAAALWPAICARHEQVFARD
ncbi:MAG TPA: arylamine N-acetyltransferase [Myxococcales bacterium]|nr:arylamine N-acetyltransferase [Myxococcales bacterium]